LDNHFIFLIQIEALQQEISVLRTLQHENIVRYLGCSVEDNTFNIFLEYIPGGSIASVIKKFSSLNESVIRRYTKQILMGLEYLHSHQIIHRDIKGANILVDNKGVIKLADFGASRKLEGPSPHPLCFFFQLSCSQFFHFFVLFLIF
jgi:serine/threonine protein kinase